MNNQDNNFGRFFEEFQVGTIYKHWPGKTITESDNNFFTLLTMNHHPVHIDTEFCKSHQHGKILVVGTLVFSLVVGLSVRDISGKAIANLGYENIVHHDPVFIGDTLHAQTEVLGVRESKKKLDRGVIYVETTAYNQKKQNVLTFRRNVLLYKKL